MNTLVVDSSVIVKWLNAVDEQNLKESDKLLAEAIKGKVELIAPELAKYEIGNMLLLKKKLSPEDVGIPIHYLHYYPIQFISESEELAKETFQLAYDNKITYYDAAFLTLAKKYNATLITENVKHQGRASNIKVTALRKSSSFFTHGY